MKKLFTILLLFVTGIVSAQSFNMTLITQPGTGTPLIQTSVSTLSTQFITNTGTASTAQTFTTTGSNLTGAGTVTAPSGYEVSLDGVSFASTKNLPLTGSVFTGQPVTIYIRLAAATSVGTYNGNVAISSSGAVTRNVSVTGIVNSTSPALTLNGTYGAFTSTFGTASIAQTITVTGINLTAGCTVTPPTGYELSLNGSSFASSQSISQSGGNLVSQPVTVYTRLTSSATVGSHSGNVTFASSGATTQNAAVSGTVNSPGSTNDTTNINIADSLSTTGTTGAIGIPSWYDWNQVSDLTPGTKSGFVTNNLGVTTPIQVRLSSSHFFVDNGAGYNSSTTSGFPVVTYRLVISNTTALDTLVITGLPVETNGYKLILGCSRSTTTTRHVTFTETISGATQTVTAGNNDTPVILDNLTPASGVLKIVITDDTNFWFLNFIQIIGKH